MASIKSISGIVFYVSNLKKSKKFYEGLGFRFGTPKGDYITAYINWFWIELRPGEKKEGGTATQISVDSVDEFYEDVKSKGLKPEDVPKDIPQGRREFMLRDPDGYKLVFFTKK
jgi:catechol 2,3-dioxygenase-like lactoylglutathione lyase family enzyme